jgi:prephenate dehydrogenase
MNLLTAILLCATLLPVSTAKERRLRQEFDDLAAQTSALVEVVDHMEANLHRQGQTLHPDIAAARNSLVTTMNRASDALEQRDWTELRKSLDRARGWIDRLRRQL